MEKFEIDVIMLNYDKQGENIYLDPDAFSKEEKAKQAVEAAKNSKANFVLYASENVTKQEFLDIRSGKVKYSHLAIIPGDIDFYVKEFDKKYTEQEMGK